MGDTECDDCGAHFRTPKAGHPDRHRIRTGLIEDEKPVIITVCSTCNERRWLEVARARGLDLVVTR